MACVHSIDLYQFPQMLKSAIYVNLCYKLIQYLHITGVCFTKNQVSCPSVPINPSDITKITDFISSDCHWILDFFEFLLEVDVMCTHHQAYFTKIINLTPKNYPQHHQNFSDVTSYYQTGYGVFLSRIYVIFVLH